MSPKLQDLYQSLSKAQSAMPGNGQIVATIPVADLLTLFGSVDRIEQQRDALLATLKTLAEDCARYSKLASDAWPSAAIALGSCADQALAAIAKAEGSAS